MLAKSFLGNSSGSTSVSAIRAGNTFEGGAPEILMECGLSGSWLPVVSEDNDSDSLALGGQFVLAVRLVLVLLHRYQIINQ